MSKDTVLEGAARENLLSRVAAMHKTSAVRSADSIGIDSSRAKFVDFATLPGYEELRLRDLIGKKLGIENPYFRMHDARASARTRIDGRELLNFSCYDYLGLNGHPEVAEATKAAVDRYGISASASRHVAGERMVHRSLERALAAHYSVDDALLFVSGYATNVSVIGQLVGPRDLVITDSAVHNSAVMGAVLSTAARRNFAHNDLDNLEQVLASVHNKFERILIVVEGLYSMDGDYPDLPRLVELKTRYHAWLMIDEAHALGVLGPRGGGIAEHFGVDPRLVDIWMGTVSKTLAGCGGYIAGSAMMVDYLRLTAGAFVYSVGMPPAIAAAVEKALEVMHREPERVSRLQDNGAHFVRYAQSKGLDTGLSRGLAVVPVIVADSISAVMLSQELFRRGVNAQPVLYPAVPANSPRVRFFLTAMHSKEDTEHCLDIAADIMSELPERLRVLQVAG